MSSQIAGPTEPILMGARIRVIRRPTWARQSVRLIKNWASTSLATKFGALQVARDTRCVLLSVLWFTYPSLSDVVG